MRSSSFVPYVSRVVEVAPETAGAGFDFTRRSLTRKSPERPSPSWMVKAASGLLILDHHVARAGLESHRPLRAVAGVLCPTGRWSRPVPVELELLPWSRSRSELGLRCGAQGCSAPAGRSHGAYLRAAHDVLDVLGRALETPPPDWLARLAWGSSTVLPPPERARGRRPEGTVIGS